MTKFVKIYPHKKYPLYMYAGTQYKNTSLPVSHARSGVRNKQGFSIKKKSSAS